jgi:hypothetical protein
MFIKLRFIVPSRKPYTFIMKAKIITTLLLAFILHANSIAQSIFNFSFHYTNIGDTSTHFVFLVLLDDGTGFYRVNTYDEKTKIVTLIDLDMVRQYAVEKNGSIDSTKIVFMGLNPKVIAGDTSYDYIPDQFWFKLNAKTNLYEPWGITSPEEGFVAQGVFNGQPNLLNMQDLTKELVSYYFLPGDEIYDNLFVVKTRGLTTEEKSSKILLLTVADINDDDIGVSCAKDQARIIKTFGIIAERLGIKMEKYSVDGNSYNKLNVQQAIQSLNPTPNDIVVFYYSGHGFTIPKSGRRFPNLSLRPNQSYNYLDYYLNVEDIFNTIKAKNGRLNLVISDCCNNDPTSSKTKGSQIPKTRQSGLEWSINNLQTLFMNPKKTSLLMTAAEVSELASSTDSDGGFFSYYFKVALENNFGILKKDVSWKQILDEARQQTIEKAERNYCDEPHIESNICKQHPFYTLQ